MPSGSLSARLNTGSLYSNARSKVSSAVGSPSARRQAFSTIMTSLAGAGGSMVMVTSERSEGSSSPLPAKPLPEPPPAAPREQPASDASASEPAAHSKPRREISAVHKAEGLFAPIISFISISLCYR